MHFYSLSDRFFGREAEVRELDAWIAEADSPVGVRCICALGGSGKSALAWHWVSHAPFRQLGFRGVFWCSFYEKNFNFPEFLRRSLEWCGQGNTDEIKTLTRTELERRLLQVLKDEPFVFVLDGLERLMNGYAIVFDRAVDLDAVRAGKEETEVTQTDRQLTDPRSAAFLKRLTRAMKSKVVITTRLAPAELEEEPGVAVQGAKFMMLRGLAPEEVTQLWGSILPQDGIDTELAAIFALCDNHPLVVSILARSAARAHGWRKWRADARHADFVPASSATPMEARAHVIGMCLRDLDERSYDVLGALATSGKAMSLPLLGRILQGSSELSGDRRWTSEEQVRGELDALVALGFVGATKADDGTMEYDVHPVVRGAVWNLMTDARGERHLRHALSEFFATPDRKDPNDGIDLNRAITLFRLLVQSDEVDRAWEMYFNKLWWPLAVINDHRTLLDLFELLLPGGDPLQLLPLKSRREQANSSDVLGSLLMQAGNRDVSQRLLRWCGAIRLQIGDFLGFLDARHSRMWQTMYEGRLFEAETELRQMRIQAAHFGADDIRHVVECWIGLTMALRGNKKEAFRQFQLAQGQTTSHRWWAQGLAEGYVYLEDPDQAIVWLDEAAATATLLAEGRLQEAWELVTRGMAQFQKGQWDAAEESLVNALEHALRSNYAIVQCFAIPYIAQIFLKRGELAEAESRIESYFRLDEHSMYALAATDAWRVRALCALERGDSTKAIEYASRAYRLAACDGPPFAYEAGLRRALATLEKAGGYAPQVDARLAPSWKEELERLDTERGAAADESGQEEVQEAAERVAYPVTPEEARRRLAELAVMREASDHDRRWWQEVTKDTHIDIKFRLGRAIEAGGITLERFREAYESSSHKSVLVTFLRLQADGIVYPQRPRPVSALDEAEQREWLSRAEQHAKALDSFTHNVEFADRLRGNLEVHEFDEVGIRAFLHDAKRRIGFDGAGLGRQWWTQLERTSRPLDVLILAEAIFWSGLMLDEFVSAIAANADRGIEYAFLAIRAQRAIAELEAPTISRTEGWSDLQIFLRLQDVKQALGWGDASEPARQFWTKFEQRNERTMGRVLHLAEELAFRRASIDRFYQAYLLSNTDHVEANLSYLDYTRLKDERWNSDFALLDEVGRSASVRSVNALTFSNTSDWSSEQLAARLGALKDRLQWQEATDDARNWWMTLEEKFGPRVAIRLAEELEARQTRLLNLHLAHVDGGTDNVPAAFAYLDHTLLKEVQLEKARQRASAYVKQGEEHVSNKRYRDAAASFLAAVREAPQESEYYLEAAKALGNVSDAGAPAVIAERIHILERGIAKCPDAANLYLESASLAVPSDGTDADQGTGVQKSVAILERGIARCPKVTSLYIRLADLYEKSDIDVADIRRRTIDLLERGIAHPTEDPAPLYARLATAWEHADDLDRKTAVENAISVLERGIAQCPRGANLYVGLANLYGTLTEVDAAEIHRRTVELLERGISSVPWPRDVYRKLAEVWEHASGIDRDTAFQHAIAVLERARYMDDELDALKLRRTYGALSVTEPWLPPIAVEIADDLVPFVDSKQDSGVFLSELIPAMKDRIERAFALRPPGIRFRGDSLLRTGAYRVLLDEIPLMEGALVSTARYVLSTEARAAGVTTAREIADPLTDQPALMVEPVEAERLQANGINVWTVPHFLIRHLERILSDHLHHFAEIQNVHSLLNGWREHGHGALIDRKLPAARDRVAFCRLFRALLRDGIRVSQPDGLPIAMLEALPDTPVAPDSFADALATIRVKLRSLLTGNLSDVGRVTLAPELQERLQIGMHSLDAEEHMKLLDEVRDHVQYLDKGRRALVVSDPAVRAWLQRLVAPVFPDLKVMSNAEIQEESGAFA